MTPFTSDSFLRSDPLVAPGLLIAFTLVILASVSLSSPLQAQEPHSTRDNLPSAVADTSASGSIYVLDTDHHRVVIFDANGNQLAQFEHSFDLPTGMALDAINNVYVKDGNYHCQADKFNDGGQFVFQFGACGTDGIGLGIFDNIGSMAIDASGDIWVSSRDFYYIQKIDSSGNFLKIICMANVLAGCAPATSFAVQPYGIALDHDGDIYVTNVDPFSSYSVVKFSSNGVYLATIGSTGSGNGQFNYPQNLAIDSTGNIFVADTGNNRVQKFDSQGNYLSQFGSFGSGDGQFDYPVGLAFDSYGNIYVSDLGNDRIQKFGSDGTYLSQFGNGRLFGPIAVAVRK